MSMIGCDEVCRHLKNKKAEVSQRWVRDAPYIWDIGVPDYAHCPTATFPEIFNGLLFRSILWMSRVKQEAQLPQRNSASAAHMEGGEGG